MKDLSSTMDHDFEALYMATALYGHRKGSLSPHATSYHSSYTCHRSGTCQKQTSSVNSLWDENQLCFCHSVS